MAMTWSSGRLGSAVYNELAPNFEMVKLGRNIGRTRWCLGNIPTIESSSEVLTLYHLAWSLHDRKKGLGLNEIAVERLADFSSNFNNLFVYLWTCAAASKSEYGFSKLAAEPIVSSFSRISLRIGIASEANTYMKIVQRCKPQFETVIKVSIHVNHLQELINWAQNFMVRSSNLYEKQKVVLVSSFVNIQNLCSSDFLVRLRFPEEILVNSSNFLLFFSSRFRNLCDLVTAIKTPSKLLLFEALD